MPELSHVDTQGKAKMVDVSLKNDTLRHAKAQGYVFLNETAFNAVRDNKIKKGDVLSVAKIAGIQAAKKTNELIPLCHNIFISHINLSFELIENENAIVINSEVSSEAKTGVEMEAMTAVAVASLTVYDMCKALDRSIKISDIVLKYKTGGKSGTYVRK